MGNDFNTPNAITVLYQVLKDINVILRQKEKDIDLLNKYLKTLDEMFYVLGLIPEFNKLKEDEKDLVQKWQKARSAKDFALADELRKAITEKGIVL